MNIITAFTYILLAILVVAGIYGLVFSSLYGSTHSLTPNTPKGLNIDKRGLASYNTLAAKISIADAAGAENNLLFNSIELDGETGLLTLFKWKTNSRDFESVLVTMENIARSYNPVLESTKTSEHKLDMLKKFVDRMDKELPADNPINSIPWDQKSIAPFSIFLPRFLASYLIMTTGKIDTLTRNKALNLLKRLVPAYNKSLGKTYTNFMSVYLAVPYLVGVLIERPEDLRDESKEEKISIAYKFMNPEIQEKKFVTANSWYNDWAYTLSKQEFSYTPIVGLAGFYSNIWVSLGLPFNGITLFRNALNKLLHPTINVVPMYAFWGFCGINHDFKFFGSVPSLGTFVYPSVGVGTYKAYGYYFHIRVQKQGQSIAPRPLVGSDREVLIAAQSRKIYFLDHNRDTVVKCDKDFHPHIVDLLGTIGDTNELQKETTKLVSLPEATHSFIGIVDGGLVWMNKYNHPTIATCSMYEIGVFCSQGCFQYYEIKNAGDKKLGFKVAKGQPSADGEIEIDVGATVKINVAQKLAKEYNPNVTHVSEYNFTFETPKDKYTVKYYPTLRVAVLTTSNRSLVISESPKLKDSITYDNKKYDRQQGSLTYVTK